MKSNYTHNPSSFYRRSKFYLAGIAFSAMAMLPAVHGQTVTTAGGLQTTLNTSGTPGTTNQTITFGNSISIAGYSTPGYNAGSGFLGAINAPTGGAVLTINGSGNSLTGGGNALFFASPENETATGGVSVPTPQSVTIENLTISGATSQGGNTSYGGGGAGLGGGAFVGAGVTLTLTNVNVTGNSAAGGSTGIEGGGSGGGGGIGGSSTNLSGGGLYANNANGGSGGFGGGGGFNNSGTGTGYTGGFGGGGGYSHNGGAGGFGGGGSGRASGNQGFGGVGGGQGSPFVNAYGGGGAGLGGGLFVQNGGSVIVTGNSTISGNTVTGGHGADGGGNGAAAGADIFMMTGSSVTLAPGTGNTVTIGASGDTGADIADDSASSLPSGQGYTAGTAAGAGLVLGSSTNPNGTVYLYGNNTYAGGTTLQDGVTLVVGSSQALGGGVITMIDPTMVYANGDNVANPIVLMGDTTLEVDNTDSATQSGVISQSGGSYGITKTGTGTLALTNANTYSGGTTISAGTLQAESNTALGTGAVTVSSGGSLQLNGGVNLANTITISGTGAGGAGAIFSNDSLPNNQVSGNVTLTADASVNNVSSPYLLLVSGTVALGANDLTLGGGGNVQLSGQVTGTGGLTVAPNTIGFLTGSTANTYTGLTTVSAGAVLNIAKTSGPAMAGNLDISGTVEDYISGQLPTTAVVTLSGNGLFNFRNQGTTETIAGLNGTSGTEITPYINGGGNTLSIAGSGDYSFAGEIDNKSPAGSGSSSVALNMIGTGEQVLSGNNNYSGGTTVGAGTLVVGNANALGTGLVQVNGGTLTVGNGNHTISVDSYAQTAGTLYLNVTGNGQAATADLLDVTNSTKSQAVLGGNLTVDLANFIVPSTPGPGKTYTFTLVDTTAGYNGAFASLTPVSLEGGLTASLDYATIPDDVLLNIIQAASFFPLTGLTPNQQAIGGNLNNTITSGGTSPLIVALGNAFAANPGALGTFLDQLSPQAFGQFTSTVAFNNASFATEEKDNYLASQRGGPDGTFVGGNGAIDTSGLTINDPSYDPALAMVHSRLMAWNAAPLAGGLLSDSSAPVLGGVEMKDPKEMKSEVGPVYSNPWNFYVQGNVILAQGFSQPDVSHFDENTESVTLGTDYRLTPNLLIGLAAGYGHTDVTLDDNGSSATVDSYSPGFYASYADKGWYANLSGDYVHNAYTQNRVIGFLGQTATSAPEGNEGVANLDGGYDFHQGALTLGPLAGLQYTHLTVDGYTESGSVADLSVNDQNADSLRSRLGGRISLSFSHYGVSFMSHLDATWQHEFMDQSRGITSQFNGGGVGSFSVQTTNPSRDSALVDVGLDAQIDQTWTVFTDYEVQAGQENYFGQSVQAGVKIGF
ncbi:MAG TPA: autotransporter domain-containing protein [Candidatus Methylacidiphilales bacterium]|jgi:autotransporter-associated beta strand protein|nr:autotransporter domain-containing protein [Candidatus Methylacidiphilales bacterium]